MGIFTRFFVREDYREVYPESPLAGNEVTFTMPGQYIEEGEVSVKVEGSDDTWYIDPSYIVASDWVDDGYGD